MDFFFTGTLELETFVTKTSKSCDISEEPCVSFMLITTHKRVFFLIANFFDKIDLLFKKKNLCDVYFLKRFAYILIKYYGCFNSKNRCRRFCFVYLLVFYITGILP